MKKIVFVINNVYRSGGTEKATLDVISLLIPTHEIIIYNLATSAESESFFEIPKEVKVHHLSIGEIPISISKKINWFQIVKKTIKNRFEIDQPNIVFGTGHNISMVIASIKSKNILKYAFEHIDYHTIPKISKILIAYYYKDLNGIVVLSDIAKQKMKGLNKEVITIPNSIEVQSPTIGKYNRIIMVGRLSPEKGYERIIPLAKYLMSNYPDWQIDIFGEGEEEVTLKKKFENESLKNINMHGAVKDIRKEFGKAKIFAMTSYTEAMPMVILEAKSHGLPVIAYKNEGTSLLISDNKDGFLISDTSEEFIEKLAQLIENKNDICNTFGVNGLNSIREFSKSHIKQKWLNLIQ